VTVDKVNLVLLQGHWYEVASTQPIWQRGCVCSRAQYLLHGDQMVMENTCRPWDASRPEQKTTGLATARPGSGDAQLEVVFHWPLKHGYWIIGLDQEYRWLVVGSPDRQNLWVLSRSPHMNPEVYQSLLELARQKGYPAERLVPTPQDCP
jgi:apolipoprotein D and lipocalin family protein